MRQNRAYNRYLTSNGIETLVNTYGLNRTNMGTKILKFHYPKLFPIFSGAQDWFSLISFEDPELVYDLHCKFNRQMNNEGDFMTEVYKTFHSCDGRQDFDKDNSMIIHLNGPWTSFGDYRIEKKFEDPDTTH